MAAEALAPSPDLVSARSLVAQKLSQMGFVQANNASIYLEVTFDVRDASLSLGSELGSGSLSPAKKRKPLQSCADREFRLGITMTRIVDGAELFKGRAAEYHCKMTAEEAMPVLVNAALSDLGNPRGGHVVKRAARD
ncbi:MAG: hypothetical protein IBJ12_08760 [Sphingomonadaceae bacterium]|nr:hypothetical protein [Sphingomonadaceae bacterium]